MNRAYFRFAMSKPSELNRMLTNEGLSCTKAENSPSAYIIERKILKRLNTMITEEELQVSPKNIRFVDVCWVENKLNKISSVERLEQLYDLMMTDFNSFIEKLGKTIKYDKQ